MSFECKVLYIHGDCCYSQAARQSSKYEDVYKKQRKATKGVWSKFYFSHMKEGSLSQSLQLYLYATPESRALRSAVSVTSKRLALRTHQVRSASACPTSLYLTCTSCLFPAILMCVSQTLFRYRNRKLNAGCQNTQIAEQFNRKTD